MKKLTLLLILICATFLTAQAPPRPPERAPEPPPPAMGPEAEQEALDFVQIVAPFRVEELKTLRAVNPPEFQRRITDVLLHKRKLDFVKRKDPEQYERLLREAKLDQESQGLAEEYRRAKNPEEKNRIKQELKTLLEQLFDVREQNKQGEIQHLEEELARLKSTMTERRKNKPQIVTARVEELLDEKGSLKW